LVTELQSVGLEIPAIVREAVGLTDYAVSARYPGPFEAVSQSEFAEAIALAAAVVEWAQTTIDAPTPL